MKSILIILCLLTASSAYAQQSRYYAVTPEDAEYLEYITFYNTFDSAYVTYTFGEVSVHTATTEERINIAEWNVQESRINGQNGNGEDLVLLQYSETDPFIVPSGENAEIRFFRNLRIPLIGNKYILDPGDENTPMTVEPTIDVADRTEYVLQVVRISDGMVVHTLDSVGVLPTDHCDNDTRYGGDNKKPYHTSVVPADLAGEEVKLRVSSRRWGLTPYGQHIIRTSDWFNISSTLDDNTGDFIRISPTQFDPSYQEYYALVTVYMDNTLASGETPETNHIIFRDGATLAQFYAIYYDEHLDSASGINYYTIKEELLNVPKRGQNSYRNYNYSFRVSPNPITGDGLTLSVKARERTKATIRIVSIEGQEKGVVFSGDLTKGESSININIGKLDLASGTYLLNVQDASGEILGSKKIVVQQ